MNAGTRERFFSIPIVICALVCIFALAFDTVEAHPAWGIVIDRYGNVYFSDLEAIWKIDTLGVLTLFRPGVKGRHIHELTIDADGNLYGPDYSYEPESQRFINATWKMTPKGVFTYMVAATEQSPKGISIWRDAEGNMYSIEQNNHLKTETLLLKRAPDDVVTTLAGGAYGFTDGKGGKAKFSNVYAMTWAPGRPVLYLTDSTAIRRVWMDGNVLTLARDLDKVQDPENKTRGQDMPASLLMGLAVDSKGTVYVADYGKRRVLKVTPDGKASVVVRATAPWSPTGVAVSNNGDVYVLEVGFTPPGTYSGPRVRRLSSNGILTLVTTVVK